MLHVSLNHFVHRVESTAQNLNKARAFCGDISSWARSCLWHSPPVCPWCVCAVVVQGLPQLWDTVHMLAVLSCVLSFAILRSTGPGYEGRCVSGPQHRSFIISGMFVAWIFGSQLLLEAGVPCTSCWLLMQECITHRV